MKKIYILLALLISAIMFVGCQKDFDGILTAEIEGYNGSNGKVYINDELYACWHNGDKVSINGTPKTLTINGDNATIETGLTEPSDILAIYPAEYAIGNTKSFTLPHEQIYKVQDGKQIVKAPMVAYTSQVYQGDKVTFRNAGAVIQVIVKNETSSAITLRHIELIGSNNGNSVPLWGKVTYNQDSEGEPTGFVVENTDALANRISLSFAEEPVTIAGNSTNSFYMAIPCVTTSLEANVYYTTNTNNNAESFLCKKDNSIVREIQRNYLFPMNFNSKDGNKITEDGTDKNPFLIYDANDFNRIIPVSGGFTYKQMNSFTYDGAIKQINYFGTYEGNGYKMTLKQPPFFHLGPGAIIQNLDVDVTYDNKISDSYVGGISNTGEGLVRISNCHINANITATNAQFLGGIIGYVEGCTIENCTVTGTLKGQTVGGMAGFTTYDCNVNNCHNTAIITGGTAVGGIVGNWNWGFGTPNITGCSSIESTGPTADRGTMTGVPKKDL